MITGDDHPKFGAAKNSWLTGTASWTMKAATNWILGIRPDFYGLIIDPCIPKEWYKFKIVRHYRNAIYDIHIQNPDHISKGIKEIKVDKSLLESNLVPIFEDGKKHIIEVEMG